MPLKISDLTDQQGTATRTMGQITRADGGSFTGLGLSYTEIYETPWFAERFEPGCVEDGTGSGVPILRDHNMERLVGRVTESASTDEGMQITASLSTTGLGEETRTLLNDGTLTGLSVGFKPIQWREEHLEGQDRPLIVHERIEVIEYSLTAFPAYKTAQVTESRFIEKKEPTTMDPITRSELDAVATDLSTKLNDFERRAAAGEFTPAPVDDTPAYVARAQQFDNLGDMVAALANEKNDRHEEAQELYRDLTTADIPSKMATTPGWLGDLTREIVKRRPWANTFDTAALPAKGMTVDYIKTSRSAKIAQQVNELDQLVKGATFAVEKFSAPVKTYGGANTLSQQVIDRSEAWVINDMLRAMALEYGAQTEAAIKAHAIKEIDALLAKHSQNTDAKHAIDVKTDFGAFDWIDAVADAAEIFDDRRYEISGLAVSKDIFKKLAREAGTDGRPLLTLHGTGVNVVGELNLPKSFGNLLGVPVRVLNGVENRAMFFDPIAIRTLESPGAPFRLQDRNILNLSEDFSMYGYMAHLTPYPDALLPIKFTG